VGGSGKGRQHAAGFIESVVNGNAIFILMFILVFMNRLAILPILWVKRGFMAVMHPDAHAGADTTTLVFFTLGSSHAFVSSS
jgi:hypothetical protein